MVREPNLGNYVRITSSNSCTTVAAWILQQELTDWEKV